MKISIVPLLTAGFISGLLMLVFSYLKEEKESESNRIKYENEKAKVISLINNKISLMVAKERSRPPIKKELNKIFCDHRFNRWTVFKDLHWANYLNNECNNKKCCNKLEGDSGGYTCFGISLANNKAFFQGLSETQIMNDMQALEITSQLQIYSKYFKKARFHSLPFDLRQPVFDFAVHSGIKRSIKYLQSIVGAKEDGVLGKNTLSKISKASIIEVIKKYIKKRESFLRSLKIYKKYTKGMERRIALNRVQTYATADKYKELCK